MEILALWIFLRILIGFLAAYFSFLRPLSFLEQSISLWPPGNAQWLERVVVSPLFRWDAHWFLKIVNEGYAPENGTTQFHPLYPLLAGGLKFIGLNPAFSLLLISSVMGLGFLYLCYLLMKLEYSTEQSKFLVIFLLLSPLSVVLFLPYSESTFLCFSVASFYFARKKNWIIAGLAAFLACLARQQGIFLLFPFMWMLWQDHREKNGIKLNILLKRYGMIIGMFASAVSVWIIYRWTIGDFRPDLGNIQSFIYSILISSAATKVVEIQAFLPPWQVWYSVGEKILTNSDFDIWLNILGGLSFLGYLFFAWPSLKIEERIYSVTIYIISFSYYTGPVHPYMGLLRHCYLAFPVLLRFSTRLRHSWQRLLFLGFNTAGILVVLIAYVLEVWTI